MENIQLWLILGAAIVLGVFLIIRGKTKNSDEKSATDPPAEAEIYLSYGRKNQALAILEEAFKKDPARTDISEKISTLKK
ncbi:MAG: hypothetical protein K2P84_11375 [Undibacterium sp.]|nr:hypothetical protein [Undibacterium sp.]